MVSNDWKTNRNSRTSDKSRPTNAMTGESGQSGHGGEDQRAKINNNNDRGDGVSNLAKDNDTGTLANRNPSQVAPRPSLSTTRPRVSQLRLQGKNKNASSDENVDKHGDEGNGIDTSSNGSSGPGSASLGTSQNLNEGNDNGRRQLPNSRRRPSDQSQVEDTAGIPADRKVVAEKLKTGTFPTAVSRQPLSAGHSDTTPGQRASPAVSTVPPSNNDFRPAKASQPTNVVVKGQGQKVNHGTGKTSSSMQPRPTNGQSPASSKSGPVLGHFNPSASPVGKGQANRNIPVTPAGATPSGPVRSSVQKRAMPPDDDEDEYADTFPDGEPNNRRAPTKKTLAKRPRVRSVDPEGTFRGRVDAVGRDYNLRSSVSVEGGNEGGSNDDDDNKDDDNEDGDYEENRNEDDSNEDDSNENDSNENDSNENDSNENDSNEDDSNEDDGESQADSDYGIVNDSGRFSDHGNDEDVPDDVEAMDVSAVENNAVENNATETNAAENDAAETSATENEDDTGWDVEKIEDEMYLDDGSSKYLIKWKMPGAADSWEPEKNLDPELIDEWEKSRPL